MIMIGVIQEQHSDRCRLFQQWQKLDFPIAQDLLNTNGINVVPVYIGIDEFGVVKGRMRRPQDFIDNVLNAKSEKPNKEFPQISLNDIKIDERKRKAQETGSVDNLVRLGDALIQWNAESSDSIIQAIDSYQRALQAAESKSPKTSRADIQFRIATSNRLLYEAQGQRDPDLFWKSVQLWENALKTNPNQYIYRRRIEQYGPRLKKPYSFYDWVSIARDEIRERGEVPVQLAVEPNGAELAKKTKSLTVDSEQTNPDPDARVTVVEQDWVKVHFNTVPTNPKPGDVVAVHLGFHLSDNAKWNHETAPLKVWLNIPKNGAKLSNQLGVDLTPYQSAESQKPISISYEMKLPDAQDGRAAETQITGFALFNVCESIDGQCIFRRRDFHFTIKDPTR